ncbi:hypothetical protein CKO44_06135 [Rubrivivax gelatinosus]|nr:hypothetical protein [Rubrivivax gelatinosus]MBZ8143665.1 hypothetical protein [Rubrivivax gelatinosus]
MRPTATSRLTQEGATAPRPQLLRRRALPPALVSRFINFARLADLPEHRRRVAASRRILAKLAAFKGDRIEARTFAYLRATDPLVF